MLSFLFGKKRKKDLTEKPLIFAHRGARKLAPENTLSAFRKAIKHGFDGVEFDVVLTKDKVPIVFHGNDLSHSTRASGLIHEMDSKEVFKIDAGSLFGPKYAGEKIPSLSEALALLVESNLHIDIEIKSQPKGHKGIEKIVAETIYKFGLKERVLVTSFSPLILKRFSKYAPKVKTGLLLGPHPFFLLKTLLFANMCKVSAINPYFQYTSKTLMDFARTQNWRVYVWTLNTRQEYKRAVELGVDGIITDEPELTKV